MVARRARASGSCFSATRPGFVLDDVLVHGADQIPCRLQRARELELLELRAKVSDGLLRQLCDRLVAERQVRRASTDTELRH